MEGLPLRLLQDARLLLLDFDGVVTTESEDIALKAQTVGVFAAVARRMNERPLKMVRLAGQAIYEAGGTLQLGPLLYHAARLLKPRGTPIEPTLERLVTACVDSLDYRDIRPAGTAIHRGLRILKAQRTEVAIFTNGVRENVFRALAVKGLEDICPREQVFDAISTLDQRGYLHPKPDPRGYRMVLAELGFLAESCIVVDNSRKNARAAKRKVGCAASIYLGTHLKAKDRGVIDYRAASFDSLMASIADALTPSQQAEPDPEPSGLAPDGRAAETAGLR